MSYCVTMIHLNNQTINDVKIYVFMIVSYSTYHKTMGLRHHEILALIFSGSQILIIILADECPVFLSKGADSILGRVHKYFFFRDRISPEGRYKLFCPPPPLKKYYWHWGIRENRWGSISYHK